MAHPFLRAAGALAAVLAMGLLPTACNKAPQAPAPTAAPPPPEVLVEVVRPQRVVVSTELPGRVQARRTAEVRARVEGIIQERRFREGSEVKAGDLLFQIDAARLQADADAARANLARAEADLTQTRLKQKRIVDLLARKSVSQQEYDESLAQLQRAQADVDLARAALTRATIDLEYARVVAPISGRIGRALVTEGALVGRNDATHLATIEQLDPIYVNFTQARGEMMHFSRERASRQGSKRPDPTVRILLEDGSLHEQEGTLLFAEMTVDPGTAEVLLRAEVPNPRHLLLPGMFVRVIAEQAIYEQALTVSQRALVRSAQGATVMTVDADGKVVPVTVTTGRAQGDRWIITSGLSGGEQVIVEGLQKVKPGGAARAVVAEGSPASHATAGGVPTDTPPKTPALSTTAAKAR